MVYRGEDDGRHLRPNAGEKKTPAHRRGTSAKINPALLLWYQAYTTGLPLKNICSW